MSFKKTVYSQIQDKQDISNYVLKKIGLEEENIVARQIAQNDFEDSLLEFASDKILEVASADEVQALTDFKARMIKLSPHLSQEEIGLEFLSFYPRLKENIMKLVPQFIERYIDYYKLIYFAGGK
jgi:hypothetical protein